MDPRLNHWKAAPDLMQAVLDLNKKVDMAGLESELMHLVKLRTSQINGCAFCIEMHAREARDQGETEARIHLLSAWEDSYLFSEREKLAFAWTEALTRLGASRPDSALFDRVSAEFEDRDLVVLSTLISVINTWNRISIGFGAVHADARTEVS